MMKIKKISKNYQQKPLCIKPELSEKEIYNKLMFSITNYNNIQRDKKITKVNGYRAIEKMPNIARALGFDVKEMSVYYKITSNNKRAVYISKKYNKVELSGFTVESPEFKKIDQEEAKRRHMGRVQAQIRLDNNPSEDKIISSFLTALQELKK